MALDFLNQSNPRYAFIPSLSFDFLNERNSVEIYGWSSQAYQSEGASSADQYDYRQSPEKDGCLTLLSLKLEFKNYIHHSIVRYLSLVKHSGLVNRA